MRYFNSLHTRVQFISMGARMSIMSLPWEDADALANQTYFTVDQIQRLYQRFTFLDKDNSGTLSPSEFLAIPEFSMNPLNSRTLAMFQLQQHLNESKRQNYHLFSEEYTETALSDNSTESLYNQESYQIRDFFHRMERNEFTNMEVDFLSFVQTLSIFSPAAPVEEKMRFAFLAFNLNGDGMIKTTELSSVLQSMVGDQIPRNILGPIVDRVISECDVLDHDGKISFEEFRRMFMHKNLANRMIISI